MTKTAIATDGASRRILMGLLPYTDQLRLLRGVCGWCTAENANRTILMAYGRIVCFKKGRSYDVMTI